MPFLTERDLTAYRLVYTQTLCVIKRTDSGWSTTELPPRREPPGREVANDIITCFLEISALLNKFCMIFEDGFMDHDLEDFRSLLNSAYRDNPAKQIRYSSGERVNHFSRRHFDKILYTVDKRQLGFTYVFFCDSA